MAGVSLGVAATETRQGFGGLSGGLELAVEEQWSFDFRLCLDGDFEGQPAYSASARFGGRF